MASDLKQHRDEDSKGAVENKGVQKFKGRSMYQRKGDGKRPQNEERKEDPKEGYGAKKGEREKNNKARWWK